ncbi:MAG: metalloregulator ArsR/SmtB family transcription factor [Thermoflexales bacterium]
MTDFQRLSALLRRIAHPARLEILNLMRGGEICVCQMEARLGYRQAYISQHLMALREAGLVADRRQGWKVFYRPLRPGLFALLDLAAETLNTPPVKAESGLKKELSRKRHSPATPGSADSGKNLSVKERND